jgi:hypothetical protein
LKVAATHSNSQERKGEVMKMLNKIVVTLLAITIAGCALPQRHGEIIDIDPSRISAATFPSEIRGAYFVPQGNTSAKVKFCAEPAPDVALDSLQKLAASLKTTNPTGTGLSGDASLDASLNIKVVQLAGRTQLLLIAREMLYRACELSLNNPASTQDILAMYNTVAGLIKDLGNAEKTLAAAELQAAEAKRAKALKAAGATIDQILKTK